jgi:hypothetical protein
MHILLLVLTIIILGQNAWAVTYYVDQNSGNDRNDGLSPKEAWKTIKKVNSFSYPSGTHIIKFEAGDTWPVTGIWSCG